MQKTREQRSDIERKEKREEAQKRRKITREERNDLERKETRDVDQKRKQKIRKIRSNQKKHITDSIEKKKVLLKKFSYSNNSNMKDNKK